MTNSLSLSLPDGQPYFDYTRDFDAPVEAVFHAHSDPEILGRWLGPNGYEMVVEQHDFRTGGRYRYLHRDPDGEEFWFNGVFHVVRENAFVIQTFEFEGVPDVVSIETLTFEDLGDGRTRLVGHATYPSLEARDAMAESGMEVGMSQGYERLDTILRAS